MWPFKRSKDQNPRNIQRSGKYGGKRQVHFEPKIETYRQSFKVKDFGGVSHLPPEVVEQMMANLERGFMAPMLCKPVPSIVDAVWDFPIEHKYDVLTGVRPNHFHHLATA